MIKLNPQISHRFREVRTSLNLSQDEFGLKLGVTNAAISRIEKGSRNVTEQMLLAVCRTFDVNESWLRTGEGDMFLQLDREDELAKWAGTLVSPNNNNEFMKKFIFVLSKLDIEDWKVLEKIVTLMSEENRKG